MSDLDKKLNKAQQILLSAIDEYEPTAIIGLFSGGHDSYTVTHFADTVCQMNAVCHIDTGIGVPETQQFVIDRCKAHNWPLKIYRAMENVNAKGKPDPQDYEEIVRKHGFPGPHGHRFMYIRLKERAINRIMRDIGGRVVFISGVRREESTRRMGTAQQVQERGNQIWVAPFTYMTGSDCWQYMHKNKLPRNTVKDRLCMSGECLCGAFAKPGELRDLEIWYPEVADRIKRLEKEVRANGFPWGWEDAPPAWWSNRKRAEKAGQVDAFEDEAKAEIEFLCQSCHKKHEDLEHENP